MRRRGGRVRAASALLALACAGCVALDEDPGAWVDAASITGPLAVEQGPPPPARAPVAQLRVASWNLHYAESPEALAAALAADPVLAEADVVLAQEVEAHPEEGATRAARFATALGMTWVYAPAREAGSGTHGLVIASRYPLEAIRVRALPFFEQPIHARPRIALAADIVVGAQRVPVTCVHLDVRLGPVERVRQLAPAVAPEGRAILGGDLNSNPWAWVEATVPLLGTEAIAGSDQAAILDDFLASRALAAAIPPGTATVRAPLVELRLDGLYARALPVRAAGVAHVDGSDHWPIWVDVALAE